MNRAIALISSSIIIAASMTGCNAEEQVTSTKDNPVYGEEASAIIAVSQKERKR